VLFSPLSWVDLVVTYVAQEGDIGSFLFVFTGPFFIGPLLTANVTTVETPLNPHVTTVHSNVFSTMKNYIINPRSRSRQPALAG
jgi:hypothetical protein